MCCAGCDCRHPHPSPHLPTRRLPAHSRGIRAEYEATAPPSSPVVVGGQHVGKLLVDQDGGLMGPAPGLGLGLGLGWVERAFCGSNIAGFFCG